MVKKKTLNVQNYLCFLNIFLFDLTFSIVFISLRLCTYFKSSVVIDNNGYTNNNYNDVNTRCSLILLLTVQGDKWFFPLQNQFIRYFLW